MTIVVAVDGERTPDQPLAVAAALAEQFDEELVAVHVMPQGRFEAIQRSMDGETRDIVALTAYPAFTESPREQPSTRYTVDQAQDDAEVALKQIVEDTLGAGSGVVRQGRVGDVVTQLVEEAKRRDARYLVIGGRKRSPVGKAVFGSVTQSLLLNAERPVITVPELDGDWAPPSGAPVVAGVDRSDRATTVVREAEQLADALDRPLHVVHVWSPGETDQGEDPADDDAKRELAQATAEAAAAVLTGEATAVGLVGPPSRRLLEYAEDQDAACIVAAGRSRSPVGKVLFGSVTQSVLLSADRPVLTMMGED